MKKIKYIVLFAAAALANACGLLDIQPQNSMIPTSVEDYQAIMVGGYPRTDYFTPLNYLSDDVYLNLNATHSQITNKNKAFYTWTPSHQLDNEVEDNLWGQFYKSIYCANTVIDALGKMEPSGDERAMYETVLGEAYALRAYSYFYLVNMYADVYSEENLDKPGVPMPLSAEDINANIKENTRASIGTVWGQIESDLERAYGYLQGKNATSQFRFTFAALQAFRARVFLFMGQWDKSIAAATDVINSKTLFNMNSLQSHIDEASGGNRNAFGNYYGFTDSGYYDEVLLFAGGVANTNVFYYWTAQSKPAPALYDLCMRFQGPFTNEEIASLKVADYRSYIYCSFVDYLDPEKNDEAVGQTSYNMYGFQAKRCYFIALKLSEAYVTRAEAYMRKASPEKGKAVDDLNRLLKTRIRSSVYREMSADEFATDQALIDRILEERRLETAMDSGLRWFDLRRLGKPRLVHTFPDNDAVLEQGDLRYVLQIPLSEQIASPNMPLNPR